MAGVENSLAAMQQSITQLTQAIGQTLTPQGKGQGKGSAKGQGKGNAKPPGARKAENLKPHSERASPTVEEVSCIKCKAYNWTSRCVCRSCGTALPQGNKAVTYPPSSGPATVKSGGASSSSVASSGLSYAAVAKGAPGQAEPKTDDKAVKTQKADKLEALLATLDPKDPLREDLQPQLDQLRNDLRDPRQPGARLDSAVAKKRKAEAKVAKCEEALRQAEESLRLAKEENTAADSELKAAREAASPTPPPPTHPQGAAGLTLSSDDMAGLTNMLQQCGLLAVAVQGTEEEDGGGKRPRVGPYANASKTPREIAALADPALISKLAQSVTFLQNARAQIDAEQNGDGLSLRETQPASASEVAAHLASQKEKEQAQGPAKTEDTELDTPSQGMVPDSKMAWEGA